MTVFLTSSSALTVPYLEIKTRIFKFEVPVKETTEREIRDTKPETGNAIGRDGDGRKKKRGPISTSAQNFQKGKKY